MGIPSVRSRNAGNVGFVTTLDKEEINSRPEGPGFDHYPVGSDESRNNYSGVQRDKLMPPTRGLNSFSWQDLRSFNWV